MMEKCRVTQRSGRMGSAAHNDRTFLRGRNVEDVAPHIHPERQGDNLAMCWQTGMDFETAELAFYEKHYAAACEATNKRYRRERHPERCKTPEDLYRGRLTRPEELILQIGDMHTGVDVQTFKACVNEYMKEFTKWNKAHGTHGHVLDVAIHTDEASPHAHIRRVWDYHDSDGLVRLGQNKALEAAGVPLPDPEKAVSRYNNRKIAFDAMMREKWQEICKSHGFDVETVPRPDMKHKDKADYIAEQLDKQIREKAVEKENVDAQINESEKHLKALKGQIMAQEEVNKVKVKKTSLKGNRAVIEGTYEELVNLRATAAKVQQDEAVIEKAGHIVEVKDRILEEAREKATAIIATANDKGFENDIKIAQLESKVRKYEKVFSQYPELKVVLEKITERERMR